MLERGLGYHLEHRKNGFFSKRNQRGLVPHDGHWRFIVLCAELAQNGLHISDIQVHWMELQTALYEAHHFVAAEHVAGLASKHRALMHDLSRHPLPDTYNARDILNLKTTFGL